MKQPKGISKTGGVSYVRPEVTKKLKEWEKIEDCISGEIAIKDAGLKYLPAPSGNLSLTDIDEQERYNAYILRAVFYNATRQTLAALTGEVFSRAPLIEVPNNLKPVVTDVDGSSIDLTQLAKVGVNLVLPYGRAGILVDYSNINGLATKAEIANGTDRPVFRIYNPWDIINWRYEIGSDNKRRLTLVVLRETYIERDDGFYYTEAVQYRELRLENNVFVTRIWRQGTRSMSSLGDVIPTDAKGKPFDKILFTFIGAENNTADIDIAPMYDLASINIAHYRNSADYEESCFMVGQPTPIVIGLDENWAKEVLKGKFRLGSRTAVPLPRNADCKLIAATENSMVKEALTHKERQMAALGAKLVEQRTVQRTATEAGLEASAESSTLVSVARNVSAAIRQALLWACEFTGDTSEIKFELNTDFAISKMSTDELNSLVKNWQAGALSWDELRSNMRKGNIEMEDDKEAKLKIDTEQQTKLENQTKVAAANKQSALN